MAIVVGSETGSDEGLALLIRTDGIRDDNHTRKIPAVRCIGKEKARKTLHQGIFVSGYQNR